MVAVLQFGQSAVSALLREREADRVWSLREQRDASSCVRRPRIPFGRTKREVLTEFLGAPGARALIHLDARVPGVKVPSRYAKNADLVLEVGRRLPVPIPDLTIDEQGVSATLSFDHGQSFCRVPWQAIFVITEATDHGGLWFDDVPIELRCPEEIPGDP